MSTSTKVSVVMPSYNMGRFIEEAVRSALEQTYPIYELLVVDDGSTDDTLERLAGIHDSRLRTVEAGHGGVSRARNVALECLRGDLVSFLDADDRWAPEKVEHDVSLFESEPEVGALFVNFRRFDESGFYANNQFDFYPELTSVPTRAARAGPGRVVVGDAFSPLIGFDNLPSWMPSNTFRAGAVKSLRFDPDLSLCEDLVFCFSAYRSVAVAYSAEPLVHMRRHGANATANAKAIPRALYDAMRRLEAAEGLTPTQRQALDERLSRILIGLGREAALEGRVSEAFDRYAAAARRRPRWRSLVKHVALTPYYLLRPRRLDSTVS